MGGGVHLQVLGPRVYQVDFVQGQRPVGFRQRPAGQIQISCITCVYQYDPNITVSPANNPGTFQNDYGLSDYPRTKGL